jgi:putative endonuclease
MSQSETPNSYDQGLWAETIAAMYLCLKGYKILERRYKTKMGEIDIIARKKRTLAIIEVKYRPTPEQGLEAVSASARRRIERAALQYVAARPLYADLDLRFDVLAVSGAFSVQHLDNAWISGQ